MKRLLLVVPDDNVTRHLASSLEGHGYSFMHVNDAKEAVQSLEEFDPQLVLIERRSASRETSGLLNHLKTHRTSLPWVVLDDTPCITSAVQAMRDGASDYLDVAADSEELIETFTRCFAKPGPRHAITGAPDFESLLPRTDEMTHLGHARGNEAKREVTRDLAETANRAKSEFLSRMSHELRTPLHAILGFAQLLTLHPQEQLTGQQRDFIAHILGAGRHLLSLVDEVLDLSQIDTGNPALTMGQADLGSLLQECLTLTRPMADRRQILLIAEKVDEFPSLWADELRLKQALLNLLSNAVKYNNQGGQVEVSCECMEDDRLRIIVRDSGPGIASDDLERLFEPFERLTASTSNIPGTGIGLAITKLVVELMGGRIGVESSVGKGSSFWIELSLFLQQDQEQAHPH